MQTYKTLHIDYAHDINTSLARHRRRVAAKRALWFLLRSGTWFALGALVGHLLR